MSLLRDPDAPLLGQLRAVLAVVAVHFGNLPLPNPANPVSGLDASEEELTAATMTLALELLAHARPEDPGPPHASRRPRVGVGRSTDGASAAELTAEPVTEEPR